MSAAEIPAASSQVGGETAGKLGREMAAEVLPVGGNGGGQLVLADG